MLVQECFSRQELEDYSLGKLTEDAGECVAEHLNHCKECETSLAACDSTADSIVSFLKRPVQSAPYSDENAFLAAMERVKNHDDKPNGDDQPDASNGHVEQPVNGHAVVRDYRLISKLGEGGMGAVFNAIHTKLDRPVALKLLSPDRMRDTNAVERFEREMKAVGKLDHPSIVRATDAGKSDGTWFLAMELIDGSNLARLSDRCSPIPVAEACELIRQAAVGLQYVHDQGMVHRDIKPSNLMLDSNGQVKILDLGLALVGGLHGSVDELTTVGQLMGTLDYMAPEQGDDSHDVGISADIYSLGATLYKLLTGRAPYSNDDTKSPLQKLKALATQDVPLVQSHNDAIPDALAEVVHRMLARDPAARFESPADVADVMEPFSKGADLVDLLQRAAKMKADDAEQVSPDSLQVNRFSVLTNDMPQIQVSPQPAEASNNTGRGRILKSIIACLFVGAIMLAGFMIYVRTGDGELVIESVDDSVELTVKRSGKFYKDLKVSQDSAQTTIAAGEYEVSLKGKTDSLRIEGGTFTLYRGETKVVRISQRLPTTEPAQPAETKPVRDSSAIAKAEVIAHLEKKLVELRIELGSKREVFAANHPTIRDLENRIRLFQKEIARYRGDEIPGIDKAAAASQVRFEGKTYGEWLEDLKNERSPTRLKTAVEALCSIGATDHQQQVAESIIEVMRRQPNLIQAAMLQQEVSANYQLFAAADTGFRKLNLAPKLAAEILGSEFKSGSTNGRFFAFHVLNRLMNGRSGQVHKPAITSIIPLMIEASRDNDPMVRANGLTMLAQTSESDPRVINRLNEALADKEFPQGVFASQPVRLVAAKLLVNLEPESKLLVPTLVAIANDPKGLGSFEESIATLVGLAEDRPDVLRQTVDVLAKQLSDTNRIEMSLDALMKLGPSAAAAVPAITSVFDRAGSDRAHFLAESALVQITGKPQPPRRDGKTLETWCEMFRKAESFEKRTLAFAGIREFSTTVTYSFAQQSFQSRRARRMSNEEIARVAFAVMEGMQHYDWGQYNADSDEWSLYISVLEFLREQGTEAAGRAVVESLFFKEPNRRLFALGCIHRSLFGSNRGGAVSVYRSSSIPSTPLVGEKAMAEVLLEATTDQSADVRARALWLVSQMYPPWQSQSDKLKSRIIQTLERCVTDESPMVARIATSVISRYPSERKQSAILGWFNSAKLPEKEFGIQFMQQLDPKVSIPLLVKVLRDPSPKFREQFESLQVDPFVIAGIPEPTRPGYAPTGAGTPSARVSATIMNSAIKSIGDFGSRARGTEAVAALQEIGSKESALASHTARMLKQIKPDALYDGKSFKTWKAELVDKKPERLIEVLKALAVLAKEDAHHAKDAAAIISAEAQKHWNEFERPDDGTVPVKLATISAYEQILSSPEAVSHLIGALESDDWKLRGFGYQVLRNGVPSNADSKAVIEALVSASRKQPSPFERSIPVQMVELAAATDRNNVGVQTRIREFLKSADADEQTFAVRILSELVPRDEKLVSRLIEFTGHDDIGLAAQATYELGRMKETSPKALAAFTKLLNSPKREHLQPVSVGMYYFDSEKAGTGAGSRFVDFETLRELAISAMQPFGAKAKEAVPRFIELLEFGDSPLVVATPQPQVGDPRYASRGEVAAIFRVLGSMGADAKPALDVMHRRYEHSRTRWRNGSTARYLLDMKDAIKKVDEKLKVHGS